MNQNTFLLGVLIATWTLCCDCEARFKHLPVQAHYSVGVVRAGGTTDDFSAQLLRVLRCVRLSRARGDLVPRVLRDVQRVLAMQWPGCKTTLIGSIVSGLALQQSDVDISVVVPNANISRGDLVLQAAEEVQKHPKLFQNIRTKPTAQVPVLAVTHVPTGFKVDVSFHNDHGLRNSKLLHYIFKLDKRAMSLALFIKYWAEEHKFIGTQLLTNYGLITMVMFYLQQKHIIPTIATLQNGTDSCFIDHWNVAFAEPVFQTNNNESMYRLLGGFFTYYKNFNFKKDVVSAYLGRKIKRELFMDLNSVPSEYYLYKRNVENNLVEPLRLSQACIQDVFKHNVNLAYYLDISPNSTFITQFNYAAKKFHEVSSTSFLKAILSLQDCI